MPWKYQVCLILLILAFIIACSPVNTPTQPPIPTRVPEPSAVVVFVTDTPSRIRTVTPTPSPFPGYELVNDACSQTECLFRNRQDALDLLGVTTLTGYYAQVERTSFGESKVCDSFVITGGSQALIDSFIALFDIGNSINNKNELNHAVISVDLSVLDERARRAMIESTEQRPIELLVLHPSVGGREAPVCFSFVEILQVK